MAEARSMGIARRGLHFLKNLNHAKASLSEEKYRDNYAGALIHRANGFAHMAKQAGRIEQQTIKLPSWRDARRKDS